MNKDIEEVKGIMKFVVIKFLIVFFLLMLIGMLLSMFG